MTRAITIFISFIGNIGMTAFAKKRFVSSCRQHLAVCGYYLSVFISLLSDFIYNIILYYKWFVGSQYSEQFSWIAKLLQEVGVNDREGGICILHTQLSHLNPPQPQSQPTTTIITTHNNHNHNNYNHIANHNHNPQPQLPRRWSLHPSYCSILNSTQLTTTTISINSDL